MISTAILTVFSLCMVFAMLSDIFTMKIPNYNILALLIGFAVFAPLAGMAWATIGIHLAVGLAVLVIGFGLFALGGVGAGDVKMATATALWLGVAGTGNYLLLTAILGGVMALFFIGARRIPLPASIAQVGWVERLHNKKTGIPYGLALGPAGLLIFPSTPWMGFILHGTPIG